jgi:uncharacterized membrane protein
VVVKPLLSVLRLGAFWDRLRTSFWLVPTVMAAGAIVLAFALTRLDAAMEQGVYDRIELLYLFGPEGARSILSAIASSMITVAGLTFSITMLTLQLASSQFGPRLLRNFMRDRGNQTVLGTFISTFVYCLLVLRTVKGVEGASFVPHLSVAIGVILAIASLAVLIYFIHHTAHSIRIETLLASLAAETQTAIDRLYPERIGHRASGHVGKAPDFDQASAVRAESGGYVQAIDADSLLGYASKHRLVVSIAARPGSFVTKRDALLRVLTPQPLSDDVTRALRACVLIGDERTPDQDLEFSIRRIVEIAQRSLSPGINDPTTALYCIDRLQEAFVRLAGRNPPSNCRLDDDGCLRVVAEPLTLDDLAGGAFAAVARYAGTDVDVLTALSVALDRVVEAAGVDRHPRVVALRLSLRRRRPQPDEYDIQP